MNNFKENSWDNRRPTKDPWWEIPENENDDNITSNMEITEQETKQWLEQTLTEKRKSNDSSENQKKKILDVSKCCRIIPVVKRPCPEMVPVSFIKSTVYSLTDAVCRLYDRWEQKPGSTNLNFQYVLFGLVTRLKWLIKDLDGTSGTCDQLDLLIERYDSCREDYKKLSSQIDGLTSTGKIVETYLGCDETTKNLFYCCSKSYGCDCKQKDCEKK